MKKNNFLLLMFSIIFIFAGNVSAMDYSDIPIRVKIDGEFLVTPESPILENGTTLVPLRGIFETLGADVKWNQDTRTVTATTNDRNVELQIGSKKATVNSQSVSISVASKIIDGYTFVPLRFVSESLGAEVQWDGFLKRVTITSSEQLSRKTPQPRNYTNEEINEINLRNSMSGRNHKRGYVSFSEEWMFYISDRWSTLKKQTHDGKENQTILTNFSNYRSLLVYDEWVYASLRDDNPLGTTKSALYRMKPDGSNLTPIMGPVLRYTNGNHVTWSTPVDYFIDNGWLYIDNDRFHKTKLTDNWRWSQSRIEDVSNRTFDKQFIVRDDSLYGYGCCMTIDNVGHRGLFKQPRGTTLDDTDLREVITPGFYEPLFHSAYMVIDESIYFLGAITEIERERYTVGDRRGRPAIYKIKTDGTELTRLTSIDRYVPEEILTFNIVGDSLYYTNVLNNYFRQDYGIMDDPYDPYYEIWEVDLNTNKSRLVKRVETNDAIGNAGQGLYYNPHNHSLYYNKDNVWESIKISQ